ncbi:MAG: hypothetical protein VYA84_15460 [Planctomycetota bacterium]|nr:hypothetical protein [Planctomycetota bacterium]
MQIALPGKFFIRGPSPVSDASILSPTVLFVAGLAIASTGGEIRLLHLVRLQRLNERFAPQGIPSNGTF